MSPAAAHLIVKGRVQGVFFRNSAKSTAEELALVGWVCNRSDRTVEIHAEGEKENLNRLIEWCHQGPPAASVTSVIVDWMPPEGYHEFTIRREGIPPVG